MIPRHMRQISLILLSTLGTSLALLVLFVLNVRLAIWWRRRTARRLAGLGQRYSKDTSPPDAMTYLKLLIKSASEGNRFVRCYAISVLTWAVLARPSESRDEDALDLVKQVFADGLLS